jgi:hypothetical protein
MADRKLRSNDAVLHEVEDEDGCSEFPARQGPG